MNSSASAWACDPASRAHAPPCHREEVPDIEPVFARPWHPPMVSARAEHVPAWDDLAPVRAGLDAILVRLLVAVGDGLVPRAPATALPEALPEIPDLVPAVAPAPVDRATLDRMASLIRDAGELAGLIDAAPANVAQRARSAISRLVAKGA